MYLVFSSPLCGFLPLGGDDGNRTHDPLLAGQVLSQLSYTPMFDVSKLYLLLTYSFMRFEFPLAVLQPLRRRRLLAVGTADRSLKIEQQVSLYSHHFVHYISVVFWFCSISEYVTADAQCFSVTRSP